MTGSEHGMGAATLAFEARFTAQLGGTALCGAMGALRAATRMHGLGTRVPVPALRKICSVLFGGSF